MDARAAGPDERRVPRAGALIALVAGGLVGLGSAPRAPGRSAALPGAPAWLVADRDACAVVTLDEDLFEVARLAVAWPERVRARRGGGAWVVSVPEGHARAPRCLLELDAAGTVRQQLELGRVLDLELDSEGHALVLAAETDGTVVLLVVGEAGVLLRRALPGGTLRLAPGPGSRLALAAGERGLLVLGPLGAGPPRGRAWSDGEVVDVASDGLGGWWVLGTSPSAGGTRLAHLDAGLAVRWEGPAPGSALARTRGAGVWVLDLHSGRAHRLGPDGQRRVDAASLDALGCLAAVGDGAGGLLVAAPGTLLRLAERGERRPGQGGFERLTDVGPAAGE